MKRIRKDERSKMMRKERITKKSLKMLVCCAFLCLLTACGSQDNSSDVKKITIAYQQGIGYAPIHIMETKKLIEENYDGKIEVEYQLLASGAAINEGIIGGKIDIGCMGAAPAISGVVAGIPYKCIANLNSQPNGLMTNKPEIKSLKDVTAEDKIALINTGSIQHIYLAMAAEKVLGDPHALDNNIQPMQHSEGMASLESGTVALHLTSSPFLGKERANANYHELEEVKEVCPVGNTFLVAMASTKLEEDPKLFEAIRKAFIQASEFINTNQEEAAGIEVEYLGLDKETVMEYLTSSDCIYDEKLQGVGTMIDFMHRAGFISSELDFADFKFDGVYGD